MLRCTLGHAYLSGSDCTPRCILVILKSKCWYKLFGLGDGDDKLGVGLCCEAPDAVFVNMTLGLVHKVIYTAIPLGYVLE